MKILEFQKRVKAILKSETNPFFKSKYADINAIIDEIKPILNELNIVVVQPLSHINGKPSLKTLIIDGDDGKVLAESETPLPENPDPQKMGSIITYFRRYSIQSILFLQAEDDDANTASQPAYQKPAYQPRQQAPRQQEPQYVPAPQPPYQPAGQRPAKILGEKCPDCGGQYVKSAKGAIFCNNKCWLNK